MEQDKHTRDTCLLCGQRLPGKALLEFEGMPASAQNIPAANELEGEEGMALKLYQCESCGLVQFDCQPVDYYRDVIRAGGYTTTMAELRRSQYRHLIETYHLEGKKIIEAGCGQGEFLTVLTEFPVRAYGIEHKKELVKMAREKGLEVIWGFPETPGTILGDQGPYDGFLSFNFLEHQPEPGVMLDCIYHNLAEDGIGLITVPSLEYILKYDGYYELIRDHIAYYSFQTLKALMERRGFEVLEEAVVNRDTCSVIVRKRNRRVYENIIPEKIDISSLASGREQIKKEMEDFSDSMKAGKETLAMWGASHQGFTLAATTCLGKTAEYMIDSAPFKQGRYAPASHLPIVSPDYFQKHPVNRILIAAPGYTREIAGVIRKQFGENVGIWTMQSDHLEQL
ncbi:MAG: class I SAM-dependent methyltransferase [Lachnospiraceae bacterium]|nr:class I SAM-dependent methyltransferase [Lachnospiraceae bacterium]